MKKLTSQKWILSAFMIAALGSQYYYSVSSQQLMSSDFASSALPSDIQNVIANLPPGSKPTTTINGNNTIIRVELASPITDAKVPAGFSAALATLPSGVTSSSAVSGNVVTRTIDSGASQIQAGSTVIPCAECHANANPNGTVTLNSLQQEVDALKAKVAVITPPAPAVAAAPAAPAVAAAELPDTPENRCKQDPPLTPRDLRKCIKDERDNDKRDAAEEKAEKDRQAKEDKAEAELKAKETRNDNFRTDMEKFAEGERSLDSMTSHFTNLLRRYKGKNSIDSSVAITAYNDYVRPLLRARLSSGDVSVESLSSVIQDLDSASMPQPYRAIKDAVSTDIKMAAEVRSKAVRAEYADARQQLTDKDARSAMSTFQQAEADRRKLLIDFYGYGSGSDRQQGYFDVLKSTLKGSDDTSWNYATTNLIPPVKNLFNDMNADSNNFLNINTNGVGVTTDNSRNNGRGAPVPNTSSNPQTVNTQNNSGSITFRAPTTTLSPGSRGSRN